MVKKKKTQIDNWNRIVIDELGKRIAGEIRAREIIFLCALGKLVKNAEPSSFNLLVHSESSAGKDYLVKNVLKIFNPYHIIMRTRITKAVLNYWKPWEKNKITPASWDGKVLYLPDASEDILNCEALKLLCSDGSNITITNLRNPNKYEDIEIKGKPVVIITSANSTPNQEMLNRFSVVKLDESEEQTERIHNFIPEEYEETCSDYIKMLKFCEVKIKKCMRKSIARVFPKNLLRERRNFNRFLDFIKAVACFNQARKDGEYNEKALHQNITADWRDYDIAKEVFMNLYSGISEVPLNKRQKEMVEIIRSSIEPLEIREIHNNLKNHIEIQNLRNNLKSLSNLGILVKLSLENTQNRYIDKYTISEEFKEKSPIKLSNSFDIIDKNNKNKNNNKNVKNE